MATHDYNYPRPWGWSDVLQEREGQLVIHDANNQIVAWIADMEAAGGADLDNAALIAAAPDLLRACQELIHAMERYQNEAETEAPLAHKRMMTDARAAVSKAYWPANNTAVQAAK